MTFDENGNERLAPDSAPGAPFSRNLLAFPTMAACKAGVAHLVSVEEAERVELAVSQHPDCEGKDTLIRLCQTVKHLNAQLRQVKEQRDDLAQRLEAAERTLNGNN